ncbi:type VI secretion lipoprotein [Geobacter sp. OR-1]|uniref:type VI secretion system lipoprotein TssJ n=1 Tax=Geobacter sp. OR-1 TaxID=1266765 RepID=UPI000543F9FC|nr:type VI secretion system lipoprotein TssJ [Geobacter sp. OR-1]GAM09419.1 type VI secretion lipoprotein [Geobacter sp. OR-1]
MRQIIRVIPLLAVLFICTSCGMMPWSKKGSDGAAGYEKNALTINFRSDRQLNLYQGRSHSLVVCVYQLKEPNSFNQLADEKDGIYKLMECGRFDGSVAYVKRQIVQPGEDTGGFVDMAEGSKYLGVAAGYFDLNRKGSVRLFTLEKKWFGDPVVDLILGPQEITDIKVH